MSLADPISDYLTIIRNGSKAKFKYVDVKASNIKKEITKILVKQGFLAKFILIDDGNQGLIRIYLKYDKNGESVITKIMKVSTPGRRKYVGIKDLPRVRNNLGIAILTTPKGLMTARNAQRNNIGGEVLCYIW
jgi:small subunit ribosomal protein S8